MKIRVVLFGLLLIVGFGCKKSDGAGTVAAPENDVSVAPKNQKSCFEYVKGNDTVRLSLVRNANNVNGELDYHWAEKDRNSGTISGIFIGDTLFADYTFISEGMTSVRETVFVRNGDRFIEGYGDVEDTGNRVAFKNTKAIKFDQGIELKKISCQ